MNRIDNCGDLVCGPDTKLIDALRLIDNASPNVFQIVASTDGRVLGTVTDGDIRRGMLRDVSMEDAVEQCMNRSPICGLTGDDVANRVLLQRSWFLPIIDGEGRLAHILLRPKLERPLHRALLMAGGFGRRLGDLTRETPKPLLPVGGRPILDRLLEQIENAGVSDVHIAVHYKASQIKDFVKARRNAADIHFIDEDEPLGTAGALSRLSSGAQEPILVVNGDVLTHVDLIAMHEFHRSHGYDGTIAVSRHEVQIPYGVIRQTPDGVFSGIDEKPRINHFVAAGIYLLSPEFVALTPQDRAVDMPELLTLGCGAGLRAGLFPVHEYWKDVGAPGDLAAAQRDHV